jgi:hypothetical protein
MIHLLVLMASHDWRMAMPGEKSQTKRQRHSDRVPLLVARQFRHRTVATPPGAGNPAVAPSPKHGKGLPAAN